MSLTNEDRGGLVGAFIVVEGDEILSITSGGQVVRSPIDENFRPTGRSTMGVRFVTPKDGDSVAVVARSVEKDAEVEEAVEEAEEQAVAEAGAEPAGRGSGRADADGAEVSDGSDDADESATIGPEEDGPDPAPEED